MKYHLAKFIGCQEETA